MKNRMSFFYYILKNHLVGQALGGFLIGILFALKVIDSKGLKNFEEIMYIIIFIINFLLLLQILFLKKAFLWILVLVFSFLIGMFRYGKYFEDNFASIDQNYGRAVKIEGQIVSEPVTRGNTRLIANTEEFGKILVTTTKFPILKNRDWVEISGILEEPPEFEGFSYKEYLRTQNVNYIINNPQIEGFVLKPKTFYSKIDLKIAIIKQKIIFETNQIFPEPHVSLLNGMVLGVQNSMPEDFARALQITGTSHIVAVSGFNVSLIVVGLMRLSGMINRRYLFGIIATILFFFMLLIGVDNVSALRAVVMGYIMLLSLFSGRKRTINGALMFTCIVMIWLNPLIYKSIGFQLSVLATFGIANFSDQVIKMLKFVPNFLREDLGATVVAIFWTVPITLYNFGSFSLHAPIVNVFVLPIVSQITIWGIIMVFFQFLYAPIARFISIFLWIGLEYIIRIISYFGMWESFYFENLEINEWVIILTFVIYFLILFEKVYRDRLDFLR